MSESEDDNEFVTGTHVPAEQYFYPKDFNFDNHIKSGTIKSAANRGKISSTTIAAIAALIKNKSILPYGNRKGFKEDLQNINDAYHRALTFEASHPDTSLPSHDDIQQLLATETWFENGLTGRKKTNWETRNDLHNADGTVDTWIFPNPPQEPRVHPREELSSQSDNESDKAEGDVVSDENDKEEERANEGDDYFEFKSETIEIESESAEETEEKNPVNDDIRNLFKDSKFVKAALSAQYEKDWMQRLKIAIDYRSDLIKNIARFRKLKSITYDQVRGEANAYNHRICQYLINFRVYYHLPPSYKKFGRLLGLKEEKLKSTVINTYVKQFNFLKKKTFINKAGKRIKSYESLDIIPSELYHCKKGKIKELKKQKRSKKRAYSDWDELVSSGPKPKRHKTNPILVLDDDDATSESDEKPAHKTKTPPQPSYIKKIIANQNDLAMSVALLTSKAEKSSASPQKQSVNEMLNSNKRGIHIVGVVSIMSIKQLMASN